MLQPGPAGPRPADVIVCDDSLDVRLCGAQVITAVPGKDLDQGRLNQVVSLLRITAQQVGVTLEHATAQAHEVTQGNAPI